MDHDPDRVSRLWDEYRPRIEEAKRRDREGRDKAFVDFMEERIGPFPAVHLTPAIFILLEECGALTGLSSRISVLRFLWLVSPRFRPSRLAAKWFMFRNRKVKEDEMFPEIDSYLRRAFLDMPASTGETSSDASGWIAGLVDLLASQYGWTEEVILQTPIRRIFQYRARIEGRLTGKRSDFSSEADKLQAEFMMRANEGI